MKKGMKYLTVVLMVMFSTVAIIEFTGYILYKRAEISNNLESYNSYLGYYSVHPLREFNLAYKGYYYKAKSNIDRLLFEKAKSSNTIESYEAYLLKQPHGNFTDEANDKIDGLLYKEASNVNTINSFEEYLSLKPNGKHITKARSNIDRLIYVSAKADNTIESYEGYISHRPYGQYIEEAKSFRDKLIYEKAVREQDILLFSARNAAINWDFQKAEILLQQAMEKADAPEKIESVKIMIVENRAAKTLQEKQEQKAKLEGMVALMENNTSIWFAKRDIIVTYERSNCKDIPFLGFICNNQVYAGKVYKNDAIYKTGDAIRTLHTLTNRSNSFSTNYGGFEFDNWHTQLIGKEAYGSVETFKYEQNLKDGDMFTKNLPNEIAPEYVPTKYVKKYTDATGGLLGFIQKHPLVSLAIGAGVATVLKNTGESTGSSSYDYNNSSSSASSISAINITKSGNAYKIACSNGETKWMRYDRSEWQHGHTIYSSRLPSNVANSSENAAHYICQNK